VWLADEEPRAVEELMLAVTLFRLNLGDLISVRLKIGPIHENTNLAKRG
jgi:hypothetical protein